MSEQAIAQVKPQSLQAKLTPVSHGILQRCSNGVECEECRKKRESSLQRAAVSNAPTNGVPPIVHDVLRSPGQPLDAGTQAFMGSRFGHDFSGVRVHTDGQAAESAHAVNAHAYTVGHDVVFGAGQYAPGSIAGKRLLAHELTHVVQQVGTIDTDIKLDFGPSNTANEHEAEHSAASIISGSHVTLPGHRTGLSVARFSDTGHHVIEEAGLSGAGFSKEEMKQIEAGNIQRDYSQVGVVLNTILLCKPEKFGGYNPAEHMDNFAWDKATETWKTRGATTQGGSSNSPIDYITSEMLTLAHEGKSAKGLLHLGNALHTIEDFFAHSNFIELVNHDYTFGKDLVTGSFGSVDATASLSHKFEAVSSPPMDKYYQQVGEKATQQTEPLSHSRIAKDEPSSHNYAQARRLAALVVQDLGSKVRGVMNNPQADERAQEMTEVVIAKVRQYLRPPSDNDKWWEKLATSDKGAIDKRLKEAEQRTPATVNQCVFSPLKNMEASKDSSMKIPLGIALPVQVGKNQIWLQVGAGVLTPSQPLPLDRSLGGLPERTDSTPTGVFVGGQITGHF